MKCFDEDFVGKYIKGTENTHYLRLSQRELYKELYDLLNFIGNVPIPVIINLKTYFLNQT